MTNFNFRLDKKLKEDFQKACKKNMYTPSNVVRVMMKEYIDKNKEKE